MLASTPQKCPTIFKSKGCHLREHHASHDATILKVAAAIRSSTFAVEFNPTSSYASYYGMKNPTSFAVSQNSQDAHEHANIHMGEGTHELCTSARRKLSLLDLPEEVQQIFLDMLVGNLKPTSPSATSSQGIKNWNNAMRHPRQKSLSNLALVTPLWRHLIQSRLYRHSKLMLSRVKTIQANHFLSYSQSTRYEGRSRSMCRMVPRESSLGVVRTPY